MPKRRATGFVLNSPANPDVSRIWSELESETCRGTVIVAAAFLDDLLRSLLEAAMVNKGKISKSLLGRDRPLSSFSARIQTAFAFGFLTESEYKDLETVRGIRNEFAHATKVASFSDQQVTQKCNSFAILQRAQHALCALLRARCRTPRRRFQLVVATIAVKLLERARNQVRCQPLPEPPIWNTFPHVVSMP